MECQYGSTVPKRNLIPLFVVLLSSLIIVNSCATFGLGQGDTGKTDVGTPEEGIKPYGEVVTAQAKTDSGLFIIHRLDEKLYFEIPDSVLSRDILLVSRMARTHADLGYGGQKVNSQVIRWQKQEKKILLRVVTFESTASPEDPIYKAVKDASFEPIIAAFSIEAFNADSTAAVIDVTSLYTHDIPLLGLGKSLRDEHEISTLDTDRSFINWTKSFTENVEVRHTLTYTADEPPVNESTNTISVEMNQSMVLLPADPMTPRPFDKRVGYFSVEMTDYSADAQKAAKRQYITRWRLEPKDTTAFNRGELVEPKEPIVYYIDPATPKKWRPYLKKGVEDWQSAFEAAGFKDAIIAKDPPSPEENPDFSPENVKYSVIRYFPSETMNAYGPHVHDPRTGEILESDIGWYHNVMNLLRNWYFIQTAAANPEARGVEFSDEVMGKLIRFVAAHEVGHTLGLPHNWGSSWAYPVDSLRSPTFTATHGTAPSIMDYARFNYIAQPGDGVTNFLPDIGPYDIWSVRFGYRPIPEAETPGAQQKVLNDWILQNAGDSLYFYGRQTMEPVDPRSQREDLGHDAAKAGQYGVANLKRIVPNLINWTYREGENYNELEELYSQVVTQWGRYLGHSARYIGGMYETFKTYEQEGPVYEVVPDEIQQRNMAFVQEHGFTTPDWLVDAEVLRRVEHAGVLERIRSVQENTLELILDPQRIARLIEAEAMYRDQTYTPSAMLTALRSGIWRELETGNAIDPFRRNLQRSYLNQMRTLMTSDVTINASEGDYRIRTPVTVEQSDIRAYVRGELVTLQSDIEQVQSQIEDRTTRLHLRDILARIDNVLNPEE